MLATEIWLLLFLLVTKFDIICFLYSVTGYRELFGRFSCWLPGSMWSICPVVRCDWLLPFLLSYESICAARHGGILLRQKSGGISSGKNREANPYERRETRVYRLLGKLLCLWSTWQQLLCLWRTWQQIILNLLRLCFCARAVVDSNTRPFFFFRRKCKNKIPILGAQHHKETTPTRRILWSDTGSIMEDRSATDYKLISRNRSYRDFSTSWLDFGGNLFKPLFRCESPAAAA